MARNAVYTRTDSKEEAALAKRVFGDKLRSLLNDFSMNQSDLARAAGIPRDSISTYVRGISSPDPSNLKKIANVFNVLPGDLIAGASEIADTRTAILAGMPGALNGISIEQVRTGYFRLRFDQVVAFHEMTEILAVLNKAK